MTPPSGTVPSGSPTPATATEGASEQAPVEAPALVAAAPVVVPCVGALVHDATGRLLVVLRAREPGRGRWSVPGGRLEPGEQVTDGVAREVREETGLEVSVGPLVGKPRIPGPGGVVYEVADHLATVTGGRLRAGDDAADARWVTAAELAALPVTSGLLEALQEWGAGPRC